VLLAVVVAHYSLGLGFPEGISGPVIPDARGGRGILEIPLLATVPRNNAEEGRILLHGSLVQDGVQSDGNSRREASGENLKSLTTFDAASPPNTRT